MGGYRQILFASASILTLSVSGCMDGGSNTSEGPAGEATAFTERPAATPLVERDVEAPEVFQATDKGLWDGRPSLGGVWVAYPDVTDPERVIIRNEANGKYVIGALFKRERENPGPKLQVSSDAATSLGMLAGSPTTLNVTALRREEPKTPAPSEAAAPVEAAAIASAELIDEQSLDDPIASATAAIERAETGGDAAVVANTTTAAVDEATPAKQKRSWNPFRRKQAAEVAVPVAATATAAATGAPSEITTQTLDGAAVIEPAAPVQVAAVAPAPKPKATPSLSKPFVQIGIFSVEANANNTATAMRQNGVVPKVYEQKSQGKTFWRVVVGPATTKSDQAMILKKVKGMGFSDAYAVSG